MNQYVLSACAVIALSALLASTLVLANEAFFAGLVYGIGSYACFRLGHASKS